MVYAITSMILAATVAAFFVSARRGRSPFGWIQWALRVVAALPLLVSGLIHFTRTALLATIIPPFFPHRPLLVLLSGAMELAGAIGLLLPAFTRPASVCLALMMIVIFPANVYGANQTVEGLHMASVPVRLSMQVITADSRMGNPAKILGSLSKHPKEPNKNRTGAPVPQSVRGPKRRGSAHKR